MRSKIEANEYKDYILGFIFYKYLSDTEIKYVYAQGGGEEGEIRKNLIEQNHIDASKGFGKSGKNNALRASDIKKIADTVICRASIDKFSRLVSQDEIRRNEYNLNIPRYVDSSGSAETWDIYASMFGGVPKSEIAELDDYWRTFDGLERVLFKDTGAAFSFDR
jgi:type I restriction-modification system DNA methylase subunit